MMKKVLVLLGALALTFTLATAEGKCGQGKCGGDDNKTEKKTEGSKCSADKKSEKKCASGKCSGDKK